MNEALCQFGFSLQEAITLVVAISALVFSGWQLLTQKRHNKLSVKPNLTLQHRWAEGVRTVFLKNVGLGPAVICSHEFKYKGKVVPFEIAQHLVELADDLLGGGYYSSGKILYVLQVIEVGESINVLGLHWNEQHNAGEARNRVVNFLEEAEVTVVYQSMYDEGQILKKLLVSPDDFDP